ncbi:MAG TPA: universal stress protein [Solirubrobacterales bacterium]|nr:universal stress protein [Solirubrobacterales bacterium]
MATRDEAPRQVVVGFDDSDCGRDALRLGDLLAQTVGAPLRAARVYHAPPGHVLHGAAQGLSAEIASVLGLDRPVEPVPLLGGSPARALQGLAETEDVGLLVLGSTHRAGLGRVMPGSVAERLLSGAPCPVAVAPRAYDPLDIRVIAVGYDGMPEATNALEVATAIGEAAGATLRVIAVRVQATTTAATQAEAIAGAGGAPDLQSRLHSAVSGLPSDLRALPIFEHGGAARHLLDHAEQGVDLMVLGSRGYGPVRAVLLGSVSATVVRAAPCPVLVTPRSAAR